jgi:hypothetical protein
MTIHPVLREVHISDYEKVKSLFCKIGMPSEPIEAWKAYRKSPALRKAGKNFPFGWVLEAESNIVGYLANIPMMYSYQGSDVFVAAARAYAVAPEYRSHGLKLILEFLRQQEVAGLLGTTANEYSAAIVKYFEAKLVPQVYYNEVLFLVFNSWQFLRAVFVKCKFPDAIASGAAFLFVPLFKVITILKQNKTYSSQQDLLLKKVSVDDLGEEFDKLWAIKREQEIFYADRSVAMLQWRINIAPSYYHIYGAYLEDQLLGYILLKIEHVEHLKLKRCLIIDIFGDFKNDENLEVLISKLVGEVRDLKVDTLEIIGFPKAIRKIVKRFLPFKRIIPNWPYFKFRTQDMKTVCQSGVFWYMSLMDGDSSL